MNPNPATLCDLLDRAARETPAATAVEDQFARRITYRELDEWSLGIAAHLKTLGVRPGDRVGVCLQKSLCSVACLWGILRARAAYVPVDVASPIERNRFIFSDCGVKCIFVASDVDEGTCQSLAAVAQVTRVPHQAVTPRENETLESARDNDLAYILYTSGSTGTPKGVVHTHASAMSFVNWCGATFRPTPVDRFSSHAPFHFDLSILDLYLPVTTGAAVVLIDEELGKQPWQLAKFIAERKISVWYSVPTILTMMAQHGRLREHDHSLRLVLFAGEVFPIKHLQLLRRQWPAPVYYNLYGPTETNVCTYLRLPELDDLTRETPYPIGRPCENARCLVLDEDQREVTAGGEGLLYVHQSGPVMREYWNHPLRTKAAFYIDDDGQSWYRTGDVVRRNTADELEYLGRRDRMVKRRGYRIELDEIESAIYQHPSVREAAAVAEDTLEGVMITLHLATEQPLTNLALRQHCAAHLPPYMVPDRFAFHGSLPRTSTSKVDYQSLRRPA